MGHVAVHPSAGDILIPRSLRNRTFPDQRLDPAPRHGVQAPRIQLQFGLVRQTVALFQTRNRRTEHAVQQLNDSFLKHNLTACSRVFSEKLTVPKLVNKFFSSKETQRLISPLSWHVALRRWAISLRHFDPYRRDRNLSRNVG